VSQEIAPKPNATAADVNVGVNSDAALGSDLPAELTGNSVAATQGDLKEAAQELGKAGVAQELYKAEVVAKGKAGSRRRRRRKQAEAPYPARDLGLDDDILNDVLIDNVLGFETHKMAHQHRPLPVDRQRLEETMLRLGFDANVFGCFDRIFGDAEGCLTPEARERCGTRLAHAHFKAHALRYLRCFLPEAGFAVVPCLRYRINGRCGAKIVTTRHW
jgi:hypothetical protein